MVPSLVVVCTPTCNRRFSLEFSSLCMKRQTYQNLHWVIVDNSTEDGKSWEPIKDMPGLPPVTYLRVPEKKPIGHLRNVCLDAALPLNPEYIAFWDDDDYYVPTRIEKSVEALVKNPTADIVGCEVLTVFLAKENVMMETGPYGRNHSTAATYVFRASIATKRRFDAAATKAEEGSFTRDWTLPMVMIPGHEVILVIGHHMNTVNKNQMLENPAKFAARIVNSANAKNLVRYMWFKKDTELWDCFRRTFLPD